MEQQRRLRNREEVNKIRRHRHSRVTRRIKNDRESWWTKTGEEMGTIGTLRISQRIFEHVCDTSVRRILINGIRWKRKAYSWQMTNAQSLQRIF